MFGQVITCLHEYNGERKKNHVNKISFGEYFSTAHFYQTTFENWESEFLQMGMYVLLTVRLRQRGSSESKKLDEEEEVDREPDPNKKDAPWPGSFKNYNEEKLFEGQPKVSFDEFIHLSRFWFE